jgi:hypothetical protein
VFKVSLNTFMVFFREKSTFLNTKVISSSDTGGYSLLWICGLVSHLQLECNWIGNTVFVYPL